MRVLAVGRPPRIGLLNYGIRFGSVASAPLLGEVDSAVQELHSSLLTHDLSGHLVWNGIDQPPCQVTDLDRVFNNVLSLLLAEGLNPYLGHLHGAERQKAYLAFDLMEELRSPIVDSLVMRLVNQKIIRPTDFTWPKDNGGVL